MMAVPPALRNREYRWFWIGSVLTAMGGQFTTVAMAWQIYELTNSPLQIGLLGLGRAIPQMVLSIFGGLLADTMDRKRLIVTTQLGQLTATALLALATFGGLASPQLLFLAAVVFALLTALESPSRQAIVPNLVDRADLTSAIALNNTQRNVAMIIGPSLAGPLLALAGPSWCYLFDGGSRFALIGALAIIRRPLQAGATRRMSVETLVGGVKFVATQ